MIRPRYFPALGNNDPCTSLSSIVTRPTVTNSACTVRPNHVLIETGYQNTTANGGGNTVVYIFGLFHDVGQRLQLDTLVGISPTTATGKYHYFSFGASYYL